MDRSFFGRGGRCCLLCMLCWAVTASGTFAQQSGRVERVTPADNLQQILDGALAGDIIMLAPGTYQGLITVNNGGDAGAPLVVRAENPGTVTLTNAAPAEFKLNFVNVGGNLYRVPVPWQVRWVMVDGHG